MLISRYLWETGKYMTVKAGNHLSVVIPAYNESESLLECHQRVSAVLSKQAIPFEVIYVNDGSKDDTLQVLQRLQSEDPQHVSVVDLSRNFGKEIALSAGLDMADGAAVVVMDADLQDPPELIPTLIAHWQEGYDIVYGQRSERKGETWLKRKTAFWFYRVMQNLGRVTIPPDTGDFRLLSRRAVLALRTFREHHRFMKGLFAWIGFPQKSVLYQRDPRFAGETKFNYWRLWNFALEGITSFTTIPLRLATYVGAFAALAAFLYGLFIVIRTLIFGNPVAGYPSLVVIMLFLGGVQLGAIGVLGEYVGRIFNESKQRPLYFVNHYQPARSAIVAVSTPEPSERRPVIEPLHMGASNG